MKVYFVENDMLKSDYIKVEKVVVFRDSIHIIKGTNKTRLDFEKVGYVDFNGDSVVIYLKS